MPKNLFVYGTLMCSEIFTKVTGVGLTGHPAVLHGFVRFAIVGEEYPGIVARHGETVDGVLYRNLLSSAWRRLDAFEGDEYSRETVTVELVNGNQSAAYAYVIRPTHRHRLSDQVWDYDQFIVKGRARFLARYGGFNVI